MPEVNANSVIPTKILVPIDFSPSSHIALEQATELAQTFHAELYLVHIVSTEGNVEEAKKEAAERFAVSVKGLMAKGVKATASVDVEDDTAGGILDAIERENADMVVVSTHGTTGWHPLVFGSIAEKLIRLVHAPVVLIHTEKPTSSIELKHGRLMEWW